MGEVGFDNRITCQGPRAIFGSLRVMERPMNSPEIPSVLLNCAKQKNVDKEMFSCLQRFSVNHTLK